MKKQKFENLYGELAIAMAAHILQESPKKLSTRLISIVSKPIKIVVVVNVFVVVIFVQKC